MDLRQLRCFVRVAEDLHFGRAAQRLGMLPSALGRHVKLLEEELGTTLFHRTTRQVTLSHDGANLLPGAKALLFEADRLLNGFRARIEQGPKPLRIGVIDTVATGLMPMLLRDVKRRHPTVDVHLVEDKSVRLLPSLLNGRLDLAIVRPPLAAEPRLEQSFLFHETAVAAVPLRHRLARRRRIRIKDLTDVPLILPDRRSRPHSHDLTVKLFEQIGIEPRVAQTAEEKQTIVSLVAARLGVAIVPRWTAGMAIPGVRYIPIDTGAQTMGLLPLAAMWVKGRLDARRDAVLQTLKDGQARYARSA